MSFLGGLGEGLTQFSRQYLSQKYAEEDRKRQDQQMQLHGLQLLLGQNDLPNDVYVNTIGTIARLTKDPTTQAAHDHLQQLMNQKLQMDQVSPEQVPQGQVDPTTPNVGAIELSLGGPPPSMTLTQRAGDLPRNVYNRRMNLPTAIAEREASMKPIKGVDEKGNMVLLNPVTGQPISRTGIQDSGVFSTKLRIEAGEKMAQTRHEQILARMNVGADKAALKPLKTAVFANLYARGIDPLDPNLPEETLNTAYKEAAIAIAEREKLKIQQMKTTEAIKQRVLSEPTGSEMRAFTELQDQKTQFDTMAREAVSKTTTASSKYALAEALRAEARSAGTDVQASSLREAAAKAQAEAESLWAEAKQMRSQLGQLAAGIDASFPGFADVSYDDKGWPTVKVGAIPQPKAGMKPPPSKGGTKKSGTRTYNVDLKKYGLEP